MDLTPNRPPWVPENPQRRYPALDGEVRADVAIVGGGITGVTLATLLREEGAEVALVEADRIGLGVSGFTTAKVSALQAVIYEPLRSHFGSEAAAAFATANLAGLEWIADRTERDGIDCGFRRRTAYTYAATAEERPGVEHEADAAREAGLGVELVEQTALPFEDHGAVALAGQADFDPYAYLSGLADGLGGEGTAVFEGSRVVGVSEGSPCRVRTAGGSVLCERVVLATLVPILDRSLGFARMHAERSYCVAVPAPDRAPEGMYINAGSPTRSLRACPSSQGELMIVGGEGHKTGQADSHSERYLRLQDFAAEHFSGSAVARWSAQDWITADRGPYVGPVTPLSSRVYMAGGYRKWGLTTGTASAQALAAVLSGKRSEFAETFTPNRIKPLASLPSLIRENADAGFHFFADRVRERPSRESPDLAPGEAGIVTHDDRRAAAYRDEKGGLHVVSPVCTHLWCQLRWNDAEASWDCPCHGSRFSPDGEVLQGPATNPLKRLKRE